MTGPWTTPRGPIARGGVMALVLLSLLLSVCSYARYGGDTGHGAPPVPGQAWSLGAWDAQLTSLPPQNASAREHHVLSLWPPPRRERHDAAAHLALLLPPSPEAHQIRDPQQLAHRAAGSRSPPLI
ncbi:MULTISPECIES: hypothetical protein [unclassified Nonomuraea]|uniref:hypothetical protein n=1 Tax=unclassified Nonomuraea TaxID=2593643 RepID=UPI0033E37257